jgi:Fe2+ transport system protein FeoA
MSKIQPTTSLLTLKKGHSGRIASIEGGKKMVRRMLSLGLRVGTVVNILNHRGKSVVIQNAGTGHSKCRNTCSIRSRHGRETSG